MADANIGVSYSEPWDGNITIANIGRTQAAGNAGGDLSGAYPNPMVNTVQGFAVPKLIDQSAIRRNVTGVTVETVAATINLPALGPNGAFYIYRTNSFTNNANAKSVVARINGISIGAYPAAGVLSAPLLIMVANRGATNSQLVTPTGLNTSLFTATVPFVTETIDLSAPSVLTLSFTNAVGTDSSALEFFSVELREI